jgi:hypothetical protein
MKLIGLFILQLRVTLHPHTTTPCFNYLSDYLKFIASYICTNQTSKLASQFFSVFILKGLKLLNYEKAIYNVISNMGYLIYCQLVVT